MKNSELQGLFILDHNASFIPGIAGCNGEHPFVWFVFNLCAVFLQKAISSFSWEYLGLFPEGSCSPHTWEQRQRTGACSSQGDTTGRNREQLKPTPGGWQWKPKRFVQSFLQPRKVLTKLKASREKSGLWALKICGLPIFYDFII